MRMARGNSLFLRQLLIVGGLSLVIGLPALAATQLQQPRSVDARIASFVAENEGLTPAQCPDCCCGGTCSLGDRCEGRRGDSCGSEAVCCPKQVTKKVKKHCWKVNIEMVCIPRFRFECNWLAGLGGKAGCNCGDACCSSGGDGDCRLPTCGRVRCVRVLEKHETTCEKCGYEWEVMCVRSSGKGCCRCGDSVRCPSCGCRDGCASSSAKAPGAQLTRADESASQVRTIASKKRVVR